MNKRYEKLNELIKTWYKDKGQDELILRSLYGQVALEENSMVDRTQDLKKNTKYSNLTQDEFVSLFQTENFNPLQKNDIKHLFQELHNRYMNGNGYEVTRNVAVVNDSKQKAYGYVCYADDLLYINKHAIDKAKTIEPDQSNFNKTNLGTSLMFIITHESQHVNQYETAIDFALGKEQSKDKAFLGAMGIVKNTNFAISEKNNDNFVKYWQSNYDYRYVEHNANYSAFKKVDSELLEGQKSGKPYEQYINFIQSLSLRSSKKDKQFIEDRILKMEEVAKKELEYFEKGTNDCPIKQNVMKIANEYMKLDEKGNSRFRKVLRKQITEIAKVSEKHKDNLCDFELDESFMMTNN